MEIVAVIYFRLYSRVFIKIEEALLDKMFDFSKLEE